MPLVKLLMTMFLREEVTPTEKQTKLHWTLHRIKPHSLLSSIGKPEIKQKLYPCLMWGRKSTVIPDIISFCNK